MLFLGQKLTVIQGDVATVVVDAVVHPTNNGFYLGGQVGAALRAAGGSALEAEVKACHTAHGTLKETQAAISGAPNLPASKIIHVNSPSWGGADAKANLDKTVQNALQVADDNNLKSVAFPSIGSGQNGFPKQTAAEVILKAIKTYFMGVMSSSLKQIYFVLYDTESINVYTSELSKLDAN